MLGGGKAGHLFEHGYRELVTLPAPARPTAACSATWPTEHRPALFHCTTGKDRTGWAAAALLLLLGVPDELVMREYLLTNEELLPAEKPLLDHFRALGGDPDLLPRWSRWRRSTWRRRSTRCAAGSAPSSGTSRKR